MVRHAVARAGWRPARVVTHVHCHTPEAPPSRGAPDLPRFSYLPLPSIEYRDGGNRVTAIRRVLLSAPPGEDAAVAWLRRALSGQELVALGSSDIITRTGDTRMGRSGQELVALGSSDPVAVLSLLPQTDRALRDYVDPCTVWSTVTPVVMTGHDDNDPAKAERLLRRTLVQAGVADEPARCAGLEWRRVGFRAGVESSTRNAVPACLDRRARYHVQVRWLDGQGAGRSRCPAPWPSGREGTAAWADLRARLRAGLRLPWPSGREGTAAWASWKPIGAEASPDEAAARPARIPRPALKFDSRPLR